MPHGSWSAGRDTRAHTSIYTDTLMHTWGLDQCGCPEPGPLVELHALIHAYTRTYSHIHTHTRTYTPRNQCGCPDPGLLVGIRTHTNTHTFIYTYAHTHTRTHAGLDSVWLHGSWSAGRDTQTHTCMHTHTRKPGHPPFGDEPGSCQLGSWFSLRTQRGWVVCGYIRA